MKHDEVLNPFLALMRAELIANFHKGDRPGWLSMSSDECMAEINYHVGKLHWALRHSSERGMAEVVEFSADVANCCMMLLDICGALAYAPQPPAGGEPEVLGYRYDSPVSIRIRPVLSAERAIAIDGDCNWPERELIDRAAYTALQARLQAAEAERDALKVEAERLRGVQPEWPPRPPDGEGLPRYGIRWNGPQQPLAVPMDDGYWAPWHLADTLRADKAELVGLVQAVKDKLTEEYWDQYAGLDETRALIDGALAKHGGRQ